MAAAMTINPIAAIMQTLEEEEREKYRDRQRPLEDEELVGREAAERARQERIGWGKEILMREDKRWDWLLGEWCCSVTVSGRLLTATHRSNERLGGAGEELE